ncbi:MAG: metal-dependent transcriptional regulator [Bacteroidota bacterium]|nr:metal-dependent transcriptional regulator [Bacteroidota bacterium]MDP4233877.1 metal-dependent transcriptional regulator [Bacteroidota bacterium]MDP4243550.1 metal-dependent transcriptional regulator [Bacteroidota bacterium]MDP4288911.1 metal-dependent transcriptional regulator [Bacteroidota bacterium]
MHTPSIEDYLKAIYKAGSIGEISSRDIAERVGVSAPAVSKMLRRLVELKLVRIHSRSGIHLTPFGQRTALQTIRKHRLLELFLVRELGYQWDEVHDEAERLEHHISPLFEERIAEKLGHPDFDPHGDPIPNAEGLMPSVEEVPLPTAEVGSHFIITRLVDGDPKLLQYAASLSLKPGETIEFHGRQPFGGPYNIFVKGEPVALAPDAAGQIFGRQVSAR